MLDLQSAVVEPSERVIATAGRRVHRVVRVGTVSRARGRGARRRHRRRRRRDRAPRAPFRMNDYRQKGITRTLNDEEVLDSLATFVQLSLVPLDASRRRCPQRSAAPEYAVAPSDSGSVERWSNGEAPARRTGGARASKDRPTYPRRGRGDLRRPGVPRDERRRTCSKRPAPGAARSTNTSTTRRKLLGRLAEQCMTRLSEVAGEFVDMVDAKRRRRRPLREWPGSASRCPGSTAGSSGLAPGRGARPASRSFGGRAARRSSLRSTMHWRRSTGVLFDVRVGSVVLLALLERGPDYTFGTAYDLNDERGRSASSQYSSNTASSGSTQIEGRNPRCTRTHLHLPW